MSIGVMFIIIAIIVVVILVVNNHFSTKKFVNDTEPYFRFLMEEDYDFLVKVRYGDVDTNKLFSKRIRNGLVAIVVMIFIFLS